MNGERGQAQLPPVPREVLLRQLLRILPAHCLVEEAEARRPFECDGLTIYRELPLLVALPEGIVRKPNSP